MSRSVRLATLAALEAILDAGLPESGISPRRIALHVGSGQTGLEAEEFFPALSIAWDEAEGTGEMDFSDLGVRASKLIDRQFSLRSLANAGLGLLSRELGISGAGGNFVQSDTSSAQAIQAAWWDLVECRCDAALVGGFDSLLYPSVLVAFDQIGLLSRLPPSEAYRPFDARRDGLVLGEGAGFFVLERTEDAARRRREIRAEILGVASTTASFPEEPSQRSVEGLSEAVRRAKGTAVVDFVVAHGLGTQDSDRREMNALAALIGAGLPVTALKSQTGYLGAATAAVELGLGLLCAQAGAVPRICRLEEPDPECRIDLVYGRPRKLSQPRPTGLFLAYSPTAQVSAIVARPG